MPSLGHAAFFGLAGYGTALAITRFDVTPWLAAGIGILLSVGVAALFAPLAVRVRGLTFLTITLAFGQVTWGLATRWTSFTGGENGIPNVPRPDFIWDLDDRVGFFYLTLIVVVAVSVLVSIFAGSALGMSFMGVRNTDTRMSALGYNVQARRATAFVAAALVAAVYGVLSTFFNKFIGTGSLSWQLSAQMLLAVVIGGFGSLWGPFVAGSGLHILKTLLIGGTERWPMVLGILYVTSVVFLPGGLSSLNTVVRRHLTRFSRKTNPKEFVTYDS
jgi:branched-chain amino acid transport system permease protein